uniref:Translational initiation factor 1 n=1 Tax=Allium neriniflorum TaxID=105307 RepID=A0A6M8TUY5_9ASPA|nr:translational initiation factor 1 [Allium neriniflorum]QKJ80902.1 translational initiation factor 1 [Allium neriniflorum]
MIHEGLITESFPNGMLSESVYINEDLILGSISGRIRRLIRTLPGNRIKIEIRQYYSNQGTYNL